MLAVLTVGVAAGCLALGAFLAVCFAASLLFLLLVAAVGLLLCFLVAAFFLSLRLFVRLVR